MAGSPYEGILVKVERSTNERAQGAQIYRQESDFFTQSLNIRPGKNHKLYI